MQSIVRMCVIVCIWPGCVMQIMCGTAFVFLLQTKLTLMESSSSSLRFDLFAISQSSVTRGSLNSGMNKRSNIRKRQFIKQRLHLGIGTHQYHHCIPHGWFCGVVQSPGWGISFFASDLHVFDGEHVPLLHPPEDLLHFYGSLRERTVQENYSSKSKLAKIVGILRED